MLAHPAGPDASFALDVLESWQTAGHNNFFWSSLLGSERGDSVVATDADYMAF